MNAGGYSFLIATTSIFTARTTLSLLLLTKSKQIDRVFRYPPLPLHFVTNDTVKVFQITGTRDRNTITAVEAE